MSPNPASLFLWPIAALGLLLLLLLPIALAAGPNEIVLATCNAVPADEVGPARCLCSVETIEHPISELELHQHLQALYRVAALSKSEYASLASDAVAACADPGRRFEPTPWLGAAITPVPWP